MKKHHWVIIFLFALLALILRFSDLVLAVWENGGTVYLNHALTAPADVVLPDVEQAEQWLQQVGTEAAGYQLGLLAIWQDVPLAEPISSDAAAAVSMMVTNRAQQMVEQGQDEMIPIWYERAQAYDIPVPTYWLEVGKGYAIRSDWPAAATAYEQAISASPPQQEAWYQLGVAYIELDRHEEAVPVLAQALQVRPPTVPQGVLYFTLGLAYLYQTDTPDYAAARYAFQSALDSHEFGQTDFYFQSLIQLGLTHSLAEEWTQAVPYYKQALEHVPDHYPVHVHLSRAYWKTGDINTALRYGHAAIALSPDALAAYLLVSDIYRSEGDFTQAETIFEQAFDLDPTNPQVEARFQYFPDFPNR